MEFNSIFAPIQLIIGLYLLYAGITGKGQAYTAENMPASTHDDYKKMMRIFCLVAGSLSLLGGVCDFASPQYPALRLVASILNVLVFLSIVVVIVLITRLRKKGEKK